MWLCVCLPSRGAAGGALVMALGYTCMHRREDAARRIADEAVLKITTKTSTSVFAFASVAVIASSVAYRWADTSHVPEAMRQRPPRAVVHYVLAHSAHKGRGELAHETVS